jgi:RNA polymerase sigma factor (sigma-70 family)
MTTQLKSPSKPPRDLNKEFEISIEPYRSALMRYCLGVTGCSWSAEDLMQETLMKAFIMLCRQPYPPPISKAYLFRIASNAWIDHCRKQRIDIDSYKELQDVASEQAVDPLEIKDAIETLVALLPPKQRVITLLIDVFEYTAAEVAEMIQSTEGAVKAGLHRARTKLKSLTKMKSPERNVGEYLKRKQVVDQDVVIAYLKAFNQRDPYAVALLLNDHTHLDMIPSLQGEHKDQIQNSPNHSTHPLMSIKRGFFTGPQSVAA